MGVSVRFLLQGSVRLDAAFLDQNRARVPVDGQRVGLTAAAIEGEHELSAKRFAQRMGTGRVYCCDYNVCE